MRKAIVVLLALLTVFTGGGAALAHVSQVDAQFGVIEDDPEFERVTVFGTITCTAGETYSFRINVLLEDGSRAVGRAAATCTGNEEGWVVRARVVEGAFHDEFAAGRIRGMTSDGSTFSRLSFFPICQSPCF